MRDLRAATLLLPLVLALAPCAAQDAAFLGAGLVPAGPEIAITERSDYSRYLEGRYVGHVYRESRGLLRRDGSSYSGECYVLEESIRDERVSSRKVDRSIELVMSEKEGSLVAGAGAISGAIRGADPSFPSYRGLLAGAPAELEAGAAWVSEGGLFLDLRDSGGEALELPFLAEYRVKGAASLDGRPLLVVSCRFALRYEAGPPAPGAAPRPLASVSGRHELDINLEADTGRLAFVRDRFDDSYRLSSGGTERRSGFTLLFLKGATSLLAAATPRPSGGSVADNATPSGLAQAGAAGGAGGADDLRAAGPGPLISGQGESLEEGGGLGLGAADSAGLKKAGVEVVEAEHNFLLRVADLPFVADSDEIIPSERWRLDAIADALKKIPLRSFLVEGHSASVGKPAGELELSERRAKRIVDELAARGIAASRFIYRGLGSTRPLATNASEEGRARNRRVDITILDF